MFLLISILIAVGYNSLLIEQSNLISINLTFPMYCLITALRCLYMLMLVFGVKISHVIKIDEYQTSILILKNYVLLTVFDEIRLIRHGFA